MNRSAITKFIIFALLFAGTVEAEQTFKEENKNSVTLSGAFNTFTVTGCSTTDKYMQGSVGLKYDRKLNESVKIHTTAIYSRSTRISHKFEPENENDKPEDVEKLSDSGMGALGVTYMTKYFRVRTDFMLIVRKESFGTQSDETDMLPLPTILLEAGKMDFIWISTGVYHPEYPFGSIQVALNGMIGPVEFGGGGVWNPGNLTTRSFHEYADFSLFLRTHARFNDIFALRITLNIKPQVEPEMMFEGSLGAEFSF
ncbi:MAG TPA: hypothetical protein PKG52_03115 [bacterium]|nr:hypothetical protein [bacterium]HPS30060.1 hypothetical protein [bacterium]